MISSKAKSSMNRFVGGDLLFSPFCIKTCNKMILFGTSDGDWEPSQPLSFLFPFAPHLGNLGRRSVHALESRCPQSLGKPQPEGGHTHPVHHLTPVKTQSPASLLVHPRPGVSKPQPAGHMRPRMAMKATRNLLKTFLLLISFH